MYYGGKLHNLHSFPGHSLQVHVKVSVPKGIKFVGHPGKHHLTRKKCVAPGEAAPTFIVLSFMELVTANITGQNIDFSTAVAEQLHLMFGAELC